MNKQVNNLSIFKAFKTFKRINTAFHHSLTLIRAQKKPQKRLLIRSKAFLSLSGTCYQARLNNHCTFRVFGNVINQSSM